MAAWQEHGFSLGSDSEWPSDLAVGLVPLGKQAEFLALVDESHVMTPWRNAAAASYVSGDYSAAADVYAEIGALPEEAHARLRAAEAFVGEGRRAEADAELEEVVAFWRSVGATAYVRGGRGAPRRSELIWASRAKWNERDLEARVEVEPVRVGASRAHARVEVELRRSRAARPPRPATRVAAGRSRGGAPPAASRDRRRTGSAPT